MKRKVIQIAESTQLISLPRKWCLANNVKKGDELDVEMDGQTVTVSCKPEVRIERADLNVKDYGILAPRVIYAMYKKGIDEIRVHFETPHDSQIIQDTLKNETVGYEVVEQDSKGCLIKNISSNIMGFDTMLRRTFLLLTSLADETVKQLEAKDIVAMRSLIALEESNNRFTTLCRRYLNKHGAPGTTKTGAVYTMVEELEKIADEYKYMIKALGNAKEVKISTALVKFYKQNARMIREIYEVFYKFDPARMAAISQLRKDFVSDWYTSIAQPKQGAELILVHHALIIMQKAFNLLGPMLIIGGSAGLQSIGSPPAQASKYLEA